MLIGRAKERVPQDRSLDRLRDHTIIRRHPSQLSAHETASERSYGAYGRRLGLIRLPLERQQMPIHLHLPAFVLPREGDLPQPFTYNPVANHAPQPGVIVRQRVGIDSLRPGLQRDRIGKGETYRPIRHTKQEGRSARRDARLQK